MFLSIDHPLILRSRPHHQLTSRGASLGLEKGLTRGVDAIPHSPYAPGTLRPVWWGRVSRVMQTRRARTPAPWLRPSVPIRGIVACLAVLACLSGAANAAWSTVSTWPQSHYDAAQTGF